MLYPDAIHLKLRESGSVRNQTVYLALDINTAATGNR